MAPTPIIVPQDTDQYSVDLLLMHFMLDHARREAVLLTGDRKGLSDAARQACDELDEVLERIDLTDLDGCRNDLMSRIDTLRARLSADKSSV